MKVIRPSYLRLHVKLNGLFTKTIKDFNDTSDVTDADFEAFKSGETLLKSKPNKITGRMLKL